MCELRKYPMGISLCTKNICKSRKHPTGKVNLPVRQRGGALGHIPLCAKNMHKLMKGAGLWRI